MTGPLESTVQSYIRLEVNKLGWARLVRNNTGNIEDINGQRHIFGLGKGGADLVGFVQMENGIARVFCVEVKRPKGGRTEDEQKAWLTAINRRGGAAGICRSTQQALELAHRARAGEFFQGYGPYPA